MDFRIEWGNIMMIVGGVSSIVLMMRGFYKIYKAGIELDNKTLKDAGRFLLIAICISIFLALITYFNMNSDLKQIDTVEYPKIEVF